MSIMHGIQQAYIKTHNRGWPNMYWAVDLHDTCLVATYAANEPASYEWINPYVKDALLRLAAHPETHIILWSSVHESEKAPYLKFFEDAGIRIAGFNSNPYETGSKSCCVAEKFYFSILVDDKAGFHHGDWMHIPDFVDQVRKQYPLALAAETPVEEMA